MSQTAPEGYTSVATVGGHNDDTGALLDFITSAFDGEEIARGRSRMAPSVTRESESATRSCWPSTDDRLAGEPSLLRVYVPVRGLPWPCCCARGSGDQRG
ncbi:hypothetical protein GCM10018966_062780 [Streptomyces yanii]